MRRKGGFTLIELLVVIAIIGILAAMLFPVFAKARESARKTQCLSNVKNIAMAIAMYIGEWDGILPVERDMRAILYWNSAPGGGRPRELPEICNRARQANPYLREPVLLEDYVKNREIWRCPAARVELGATVIVPMGRDGFYLNNWIDNEDWWPDSDVQPCLIAWPPGWGGEVTDSFTQRRVAYQLSQGSTRAAKVFAQSIAVNDDLHWVGNLSAIEDPARYVTCGDCGVSYTIWNANRLAFPDYCLGTNACCMPDDPSVCAADWENCEWSQNCGLDAEHKVRLFTDPAYRKTLTRHMGGSNVGFADGHAKWFLAEQIINQGTGTSDEYFLGGICPCWYTP